MHEGEFLSFGNDVVQFVYNFLVQSERNFNVRNYVIVSYSHYCDVTSNYDTATTL